MRQFERGENALFGERNQQMASIRQRHTPERRNNPQSNFKFSFEGKWRKSSTSKFIINSVIYERIMVKSDPTQET